jgi:hypothetical protein
MHIVIRNVGRNSASIEEDLLMDTLVFSDAAPGRRVLTSTSDKFPTSMPLGGTAPTTDRGRLPARYLARVPMVFFFSP